MAGSAEFDDDYVAKLLAEDAKKTSQKYISQGLSAFLPKRKNADAPKPNTRFLSHIVREADSHNAALKRKEEAEARRRLREMQADDERPRKRSRLDETVNSKRSRLSRDIIAAANSEKSKKHHLTESSRHRRDHGSSESSRRRHERSRRGDDVGIETTDDRHSHRRRVLSNSSRNASSRESRSGETSRKQRRQGDEIDVSTDTLSVQAEDEDTAPAMDGGPVVRKRGRGAQKSRHNMDDRFATDYDPLQDVSLDSDHNDDQEDWDMALEAMRDRAKWKKNQKARLEEAGFDEKQISKWEKGILNEEIEQGDPQNVRWNRKGETREWDAGKIEQ